MKHKLPQPVTESNFSLEKAIFLRRSVREFLNRALDEKEISQLLWSSYGVTNKKGFKTVPSAGATFPMEIYTVSVEGIYHYLSEEHSIELVKKGDFRKDLAEAALGQEFIEDAGLSIVICAVYERTTLYYGDRGYRYVYMEAGHIAQNIHLQSVALNLASVAVGAFDDNKVKKVLSLPGNIAPIYIIVVGYPR